MIKLKIFNFSKVYENKNFVTLEPKLESPKFTITCGRALKSEKSMLFEPVSLNSSKTSFLSFELNKMTHGQISTYVNGAFFGDPEVLEPKILSNLSKTEFELFSVNIKLLLRGSILGSNFYIIEKFRLSAFTGKKLMS